MSLKQLRQIGKVLGHASAGLLLLCALTGNAPQSTGVVLFLGDSITAGYGLELSQAFPALIQEKIDAKGWRFNHVTAGPTASTVPATSQPSTTGKWCGNLSAR